MKLFVRAVVLAATVAATIASSPTPGPSARVELSTKHAQVLELTIEAERRARIEPEILVTVSNAEPIPVDVTVVGFISASRPGAALLRELDREATYTVG